MCSTIWLMLHRSGFSLKFHCSLGRFFVSAMISSFERIRLSKRYFLSTSVHTGPVVGEFDFVCAILRMTVPKTKVITAKIIFIMNGLKLFNEVLPVSKFHILICHLYLVKVILIS